MKIIEALHELKLNEKKIATNIELIQKYSSELSIGGAMSFNTEQGQRAEVTRLLQSTHDLAKYRGKIRRALAITNATVEVTILDLKMNITEWIEFRQKGFKFHSDAYNALNENSARSQLQAHQGKIDLLTPGIKSVKCYDEEYKNKELAYLAEVNGNINRSLEIINATTDLVPHSLDYTCG